MSMFIPCQKCGHQYVEDWTWYICDTCGYRICMNCFGSHSGPGNGYNVGGGKCSQCQTGWLHLQHGIRASVDDSRPASKLDEYLNRARGQNPEPSIPDVENTPLGFPSTCLQSASRIMRIYLRAWPAWRLPVCPS